MIYENIDFLSFSSPLKKEEKYLLKTFRHNKTFKVYYKHNNSFTSHNKDSIIEILSSFMSKYIIIKRKNIEKHTSIISSFEVSQSHFAITYSDEYLALISKISLSDFTSLKDYYTFSKPKTINIYKKIKDSNMITLTADELRAILDSNSSYNRIYDFERNILIPTIEDINDNTHLTVEYSKVKANPLNPKSKVVGFEFTMSNKLKGETKLFLNKLKDIFKEKSSNYDGYKKNIKEYLSAKGIDYVEKNLNIILERSGDFAENLITALKEDWNTNKDKALKKPILKFSKNIHFYSSISSYIYKTSKILESNFPEDNFSEVPSFFIRNLNDFEKRNIIIFKSKLNKKLHISKEERLILIELYDCEVK